MTQHKADANYVRRLDGEDKLGRFRKQFHIPQTKSGEDCIYLCGNSLGLQPKGVEAAVRQELEDWKILGVEGHFHAKHPWLPYHEPLTMLAANVVGAKTSEVVMMNGLTVNLHLMMVSFYRPTPERFKILIEAGSFPSDRYAVESQMRFHGFDPAAALLELKPREGEATLRMDDIEAFIDREGGSVALILIGGVHYYTGQFYDMARITKAGHRRGCIVGFDLAHAAGNVVLNLHDWDVDFACWCSYKYLNSGPGSVAGCFVHERHAKSYNLPRFAGWWGHDKTTRFKMGPEFRPMEGAEGWQLSNPPILSFAASRASLELFREAGMERLREKSEKLTGYLEFLLKEAHLPGLKILTPANAAERGCQLSITIEEGGRRVFDVLTTTGVVCDWREPDCIRVAPVPLYNSYSDVFNFVRILSAAVGGKSKPKQAM
jgi:kynureninase